MYNKARAHVVVSFVLAGILAACTHEVSQGPGVATTTSASVATDRVSAQVAKSRCRRAAECNRMGAGQMYADKDDCLDRERASAHLVAVGCTNGIDGKRLDTCIDMLENEHCDADLGQVTNMPECASYCAR